MDNFESLEDELAPATSKMTKEVLNDFWIVQWLLNVLDFGKTMKKFALTKVAKNYLTPPPTSADIERLYSEAGDIFKFILCNFDSWL